jgi:Na+/alanine symporter
VYQYYFGKKTTFIYIILQFSAVLSSAFVNIREIIMVADNLYMSIAVPNAICLIMCGRMIKTIYEKNRQKLLSPEAGTETPTRLKKTSHRTATSEKGEKTKE